MVNISIYSNIWLIILVLYNEMGYFMDIGNIETNNVILKKTVKYLNGEVKVIVEKQIKKNYELIDDFFDQLADEYKSIQSYEEGGS